MRNVGKKFLSTRNVDQRFPASCRELGQLVPSPGGDVVETSVDGVAPIDVEVVTVEVKRVRLHESGED
jgi:hypothetical protein